MYLRWGKKLVLLTNSNNMFQNIIIVFGCNHQNMLGLVRSLGEKGIRPYCVLLKSKDGMVFRSRYPAECYWAESPQAGYDYIVQTFSGLTPKPILLSSDDMTETLFDKNASVLRNNFIVPAANEDGKITYLMNKQNIGALAREFGFQTPKMFVLKKDDVLPEKLQYPVFTKSVKSIDGGKKEECKCDDETALRKVLSDCKKEGILVQQYIDKIDEIDLIGYTANGEVQIPYIQHELRFSDHAYGGYHRFDKIKETDTKKQVEQLILSTGFQGLFSVEFLVDKSGQWWFTEVNFRHDGHTYLITPGGFNIPYCYCCAVTGKGHAIPNKIKNKIVGINEMVDLGQFVATGKMSKFKWFWQFVTADSRILWNWKDNGPVLHLIKSRFLK